MLQPTVAACSARLAGQCQSTPVVHGVDRLQHLHWYSDVNEESHLAPINTDN